MPPPARAPVVSAAWLRWTGDRALAATPDRRMQVGLSVQLSQPIRSLHSTNPPSTPPHHTLPLSPQITHLPSTPTFTPPIPPSNRPARRRSTAPSDIRHVYHFSSRHHAQQQHTIDRNPSPSPTQPTGSPDPHSHSRVAKHEQHEQPSGAAVPHRAPPIPHPCFRLNQKRDSVCPNFPSTARVDSCLFPDAAAVQSLATMRLIRSRADCRSGKVSCLHTAYAATTAEQPRSARLGPGLRLGWAAETAIVARHLHGAFLRPPFAAG
ncbi:hypothetical protein B0J12DRAFT_698096 [Macrophomina phaseolina]|uniref:Uncharacterized protein n=1 Tax=Macrophomina phaseolina TaxID=35725 RepID=A0ABQ8GFV5_9PEZI|nr:hypothetical protein B0J12DRAFT_698096 [Macrophomina phaseolina]